MQKISYCKRVTEPSCMFRKKIVFLPVFMNGINCFCIHLIPPHKYLRYVHTVSAVSHCAPSNLSVPAFLSWLCHGWSLLLIDIEKGQSIFSAALVKYGKLIYFARKPCSDTSSLEVWLFFGVRPISLRFRRGLCYDSFHITSIFPQTQRQCYRRTDTPQPLQYHHLLGNFLLVLPKN